MATATIPLIGFNRGMIGRRALARADLDRTALSAEIQTNWLPISLGPMMLRPGWKFTGTGRDNLPAVHIPFVFANDDTAIVEITDATVRVKVDEQPISRPAVSAAFANGDFTADLTGWTDGDETGAVSAWSSGRLSLIGTGFNAAIRSQSLAVIELNTLHAIRLVIERGPVTLRVGSSSGGQEYINAVNLKPGVHSLAFTPLTSPVYVELSSRTKAASLVESIAIEPAGVMELDAPWSEADLPYIRKEQSGDVIYLACRGYQRRRIERRASYSWSVVVDEPEDGPFLLDNTSATRLTPSALSGDVTLSASAPLFTPGHVGGLFRITSVGQNVQASLNDEDQYTNEIKVTGVGAQRAFTIGITGTYSATLTLQRSVSEPGAWVDVMNSPPGTYNDGLDNQIIYYRVGIKTGNYTSGTADVAISYSSGSLTGIARVTGFTDSQNVSAAVLKDFGATTASANWAEGEWSSEKGYPSAVVLHEGRMWYLGKGRWWGSVSDAYSSFDDTVEGDSGPISRSIGEGPVDNMNWALALQRLIGGGDGAEHVARSSSFDEPLTPSNFGLRAPSTQGSSAVPAVKIDTEGMFVGRTGTRLFGLNFQAETYDYASTDLMKLVPEIGLPGIVRMAVQRQPDTRIHCVLSDGTVALMVHDPAENVRCWVKVETAGEVEDAFTMPGLVEDAVYYYVRRDLAGQRVRTLERWAIERECYGNPVAKHADCFSEYNGLPTTTITGLDRFEAEEVVVWGWNTATPFTSQFGDEVRTIGRDFGTFVVMDGQITLPTAVTNAVVGLGYRARFKSTKLTSALGADVLTQMLRTRQIAVILADTHAQGITFGPSFTRLDDLPRKVQGETVDADYVWDAYDNPSFPFPGEYSSDSRICIEAAAPRPATVMAIMPVVSAY